METLNFKPLTPNQRESINKFYMSKFPKILKTITIYRYLNKENRNDIEENRMPNLTGLIFYNTKDAKKYKRKYLKIDKTYKLAQITIMIEEVK